MREAFRLLVDSNAITWAALLLGLEEAWVDRRMIAEVAVEWLRTHPEAPADVYGILAACEHLELHELKSLLEKANVESGHEGPERAAERWRWAALELLRRDQESSGESKLDRLEEIYAMFGYPHDMKACSRYHVESGLKLGDFGVCPLVAMEAVVRKLTRQIFGNETQPS
jgi:hypothetical protein